MGMDMVTKARQADQGDRKLDIAAKKPTKPKGKK
jgi:hypothetical protein